MTDQPLDLRAIEARAAAATPGPWGFYDGSNYADIAADMEVTSPGSYNYREKVARLEDEDYWDDPAHEDDDEEQASEQMAANAAFIAHAREDVPAMAAEIRRLRTELATARANGIRYAAELVTQAFHGEPFLSYPPDFADLLREHADRLTAAASEPAARP